MRNIYNTSATKQPLAINIANMLESGRTRHKALTRNTITPEIEQFMVDHLRATRPQNYHRYKNAGL